MSTSDTKDSTKQDSKKKGMAGSTSDDGTAKLGGGSGGTPSGAPKPEPEPKASNRI